MWLILDGRASDGSPSSAEEGDAIELVDSKDGVFGERQAVGYLKRHYEGHDYCLWSAHINEDGVLVTDVLVASLLTGFGL